ncbi:MAG: RNA-binding protein [Treponemataceae bacterium]|nr:RNA-binding protein [Treponemataceae bacterium]
MAQKIYVGNMNYATTEETLKNLFAQYGEVISVTVIKDRFTEQSKGFGFVEMADDEASNTAIATLNGKELEGRRIRVSIAEEKPRNGGFKPRGEFNRNRGERNFNREGGYNRERSFNRDRGERNFNKENRNNRDDYRY